MNSLTLFALIALALVATASYFYGTKKNRWIASTLSRELEEVLKPVTTNYVNIGGSIGYNFTYALNTPYTNAKGTITLSPRHSLLYFPVSLLFGVRDRLFVNIFTKKRLRGEGHIVRLDYVKKARIEGIEDMQRSEILKGNNRFLLLWRGADLSSELEKLLSALPEPSRLRHFCSYPETKTFFFHTQPKTGEVKANIEAVLVRLPIFMTKEKE